MECDSRYRIFEVAAQRVRDVADPRSAVCEPLQFRPRYAGRGHDRDPGEAETIELTERLNFEISETLAVFLCDVRDCQREARRNRRQQHLSRSGSGVVATFFDGFIDLQLELSDLYVTPVPAIPAGGDLSHE